MRDLDGRVALVTGGGSGIGRGIALTLAGEGMRVVVVDLESAAAEAVAAEITVAGGEAIAETVDVSDPAAIEALADRCDARYGGVNVLCNNAGVDVPTPIGPESLDNWRWVIDVNLFGVVHAINTFVPRMLARVRESGGEAHVINTSSVGGGLVAGEGWSHTGYRASKFAIVALTRDLRGELAGSGIGVSVLCPGNVDTQIWEAGRNRPAGSGGPVSYGSRDQPPTARVLDPLVVGRHVLRAIREDALYIIARHPLDRPERREQIEAATGELLGAFDLSVREPLD